jgi:hypothetical protein
MFEVNCHRSVDHFFPSLHASRRVCVVCTRTSVRQITSTDIFTKLPNKSQNVSFQPRRSTAASFLIYHRSIETPVRNPKIHSSSIAFLEAHADHVLPVGGQKSVGSRVVSRDSYNPGRSGKSVLTKIYIIVSGPKLRCTACQCLQRPLLTSQGTESTFKRGRAF